MKGTDLLFTLCPLEMRSFLQTLLDLLQRAEDYIRDKVDLTFFTQTLPQLVEHIYSTAFIHTRERRDLGLSQSLTQIEGTSSATGCRTNVERTYRWTRMACRRFPLNSIKLHQIPNTHISPLNVPDLFHQDP